MINRKAARRYASALFEYAVAHDEVAVVERDLGLVCARLVADRELGQVLAHPVLDGQAKAEIVRAAFGDALSAGMLRFLDLLIENKRTGTLPAVREYYAALADEHHGIVRAEVASAVRLTPGEEEQLRGRLRSMFGKRPEISTRVDPELLGGLRLRVGDLVFDGSIRAALADVREQLKRTRVRMVE